MPVSTPQAPLPRSANLVRAALAAQRPVLAAAGLFSGVLNVLALTGAFYMLQIYDRVLPSGSVPTLVGLTVLMAILYAAFGLLDFVRLRLMGRVGVRIDTHLAEPAFAAMQAAAIRRDAKGDPPQPLRDLEHIRSFMSGLGPTALFDMPWVPLYLGVIYLFHPLLGLFAISGAALLVAFTVVGEFASAGPMRRMAESHGRRQAMSEAARREAEAIRALGMGKHLNGRWRTLHAAHLAEHAAAAQIASGLGSAGRVLRLGLQSGILGLGAYLAIDGDVSPGTIVAGSITLSRALAPLETAIQHWRGFVAARLAYRRLSALFDATGAQDEGGVAATQLPRPARTLDVQNLVVTPPGAAKPAVGGVSFSLVAGDGLGIIGPTASGKSSLAKALVGIWPAAHPQAVVSLDGAHISQWQPDSLGRHIGYMPQDARLIDGSIAANIARFDPAARDTDIVAAAKSAACHDMIVALPQGYDTHVGDGGSVLSGGQRQRIALARALYGDPFLVVLDEPNSNLDQEGDAALQAAVKQARERGAIVVVVAHRPSAIANLNRLLVLAGGQTRDYGPRDEVLRRIIGATPRMVDREGAEEPISTHTTTCERTREDADA